MGFSKYELYLNDYQSKLPDYLQTPGSIIMNQIQLYYDIIKEYKDIMVDIWAHFDLTSTLTEYLKWRKDNPLLDDSEWKYTDLVEKLCKSYDIIREHPEGVLLNSHMLRLLKIRTMGVGFNGTKEKLEEILESVFPSSGTVKFLVQTVTNGIDHATANVYLIRSTSDTSIDDIDILLFENGYYFLNLMGITLNFDVLNEDTLVYDSTIYDDGDNNNINDVNLDDELIGNKYDEGGE